jgi:MarR family transcriptional regulator for hemolysin
MEFDRKKVIGYWTTRISGAIKAEIDCRVHEKGLTSSEAILIVILDKLGTSSLVELARRIEHAHPSVLRHLDALEEKGLAVRSPHPQDRRRKMVSLTKKGLKIVPEIHKTLIEVHAEATKGFTGPELSRLLGDLQRIALNLGLEDFIEHPEIEK